MKILLISDFFPTGKDLRFSGGVEARTFFIAKNLAKKNRVYVISTRLPKTKEKEIMFGFTVLRPGPKTNYSFGAPSFHETSKRFSFIKSAIELGKTLDINLVDGGNFVDHFIAKRISLSRKIPVVFWYPDVFLGQWVKTSGLLPGIAGYLMEKMNLFGSASAFIAISNQTRKKLIKTGVDPNIIKVIHCGVDFKEFKNETKNNKKTIIAISRLVNYKRIKDLIFSFAYLRSKNYNLLLKIIGSGPQKKELLSLIKNLKLNNLVSFEENLPRKVLISRLCSSYIFCLPSEVEGFGITVIEAAAAGVPYVISDIPVFKEITRNGKGGFLFKLGSISDLSNKLETLTNDQTLYGQKRREGLSLAKNYDWKDISLRTEKVYEKLIEK